MTAFNLINLVFCFPETKFPRRHQAQSELFTSDLDGVKDKGVQIERVETSSTATGRGRPSKSQFKLWQTPDPRWKAFLFRDICALVYVFLFPIVFWTGLNVAGPANILLYWNLTQSPVLSAPPYNFSPSSVGYANFAFVVGGIVGLVSAGPFSDWIAAKATARNNGIREPEIRLPALVPYFATTVVGVVIGGIGYERKWEWPIVLVVGYGLSGLCVTAVPTIAVAYAVDSYKAITGEIMVVATVIKNTCGFPISYWVPPLSAREGWLVPTMVEFSLTIGPMVLGIPMYFLGKSLRRLTRHSSLHSYE